MTTISEPHLLLLQCQLLSEWPPSLQAAPEKGGVFSRVLPARAAISELAPAFPPPLPGPAAGTRCPGPPAPASDEQGCGSQETPDPPAASARGPLLPVGQAGGAGRAVPGGWPSVCLCPGAAVGNGAGGGEWTHVVHSFSPFRTKCLTGTGSEPGPGGLRLTVLPAEAHRWEGDAWGHGRGFFQGRRGLGAPRGRAWAPRAPLRVVAIGEAKGRAVMEVPGAPT